MNGTLALGHNKTVLNNQGKTGWNEEDKLARKVSALGSKSQLLCPSCVSMSYQPTPPHIHSI